MRNASGLHVTVYVPVDEAQLAADLDDFLSGLPAASFASAEHRELSPE
jgi:hypothetical protein